MISNPNLNLHRRLPFSEKYRYLLFFLPLVINDESTDSQNNVPLQNRHYEYK